MYPIIIPFKNIDWQMTTCIEIDEDKTIIYFRYTNVEKIHKVSRTVGKRDKLKSVYANYITDEFCDADMIIEYDKINVIRVVGFENKRNFIRDDDKEFSEQVVKGLEYMAESYKYTKECSGEGKFIMPKWL